MIAEIIATYHGTQDMVQSAAIIQEEDGSALYQHIRTASVELLHNDVPILSKALIPEEYNEKENQFMIFFLHPPIRQFLYARLTVELYDGRTASKKIQVSVQKKLDYPDVATNPVIPTRPTQDFTNKPRNPV